MNVILVDEFGGDAGIRDEGALAAAVMRPQLGYYGGLIEEAAAFMESLAMNHAFVDGNTRVAFFATDVFLRGNGQLIDCGDSEAHEFFMNLFETQTFRVAELAGWLERRVRPLPAV